MRVVDAATLKGDGTSNQDRYLVGDYYAAVLDGASSYPLLPRGRDGGWYASLLAEAIKDSITKTEPLNSIVANAIASLAAREALKPGASPSSTVVIARWSDSNLECYVLGDSTIVVETPNTVEVLTDARLARVGEESRRSYRRRLTEGGGYDHTHRKLLEQLQCEQLAWRNRQGGYWIAEADPRASLQGLTRNFRTEQLTGVFLATDGLAEPVNRFGLLSWREAFQLVRARSGGALLGLVQDAETNDPNGQQFPRSKRHDDKTVVLVGR